MLNDTQGNRPVLIDLGMGRQVGDNTMVTNAAKGTYLWMAPYVLNVLFPLRSPFGCWALVLT
jgi:hypothetical protein